MKNGISPRAATTADIFNDQDLPSIYKKEIKKYKFDVHNVGASIWIIVTWPGGGRIAFRAAYAPNDDMRIKRVVKKDTYITFYIKAIIGDYTIKINFSDQQTPVFSYTTTLTPATPLFIPFWPRDIIPLNNDGKTAHPKGTIHASQFGTRTGFIYFSLDEPKSGSVFYMQNLTNLWPTIATKLKHPPPILLAVNGPK
ncbi:hypothetical protein HK413_01370 [Mucilaginibacter sp. S1162]|uniref:Rhamnogalacturonan lyase domain-containing protein n=1 Tax=Mucilaginibacter humi TaxID=2732510 RepID=A0ABX1VYX3_9SPHI|nr:hypothetical protein [Mucilaginibacter humi]NNU33159.1 hypothetical protein [Mucilaginibacter humi]